MMAALEDALAAFAERCILAGTLQVQQVHFVTGFIQIAKELNQVEMFHAMDAR
jgi:hypothetical protein